LHSAEAVAAAAMVAMVGRRRLHVMSHDHLPIAPPIAPPSPIAPSSEYYLPVGLLPTGWPSVAVAAGDAGAAHARTPSQWALALASLLLQIDASAVHAAVVGDVVQFLVYVNATTKPGVLASLGSPFFDAAFETASSSTLSARSEAYFVYSSGSG